MKRAIWVGVMVVALSATGAAIADSSDNDVHSSLSTVLSVVKPQDGTSLLGSPLLSGGDDRYYSFHTVITGMHGGEIYSWWPDLGQKLGSPMPLQGAIIKPIQMTSGLRMWDWVEVVGQYTKNVSITLGNGSTQVVPYFKNAYVFKQ